MTPHDHATFVPGCFRCELGRDEAMDALAAERDHYRDALKLIADGRQLGALDFKDHAVSLALEALRDA